MTDMANMDGLVPPTDAGDQDDDHATAPARLEGSTQPAVSVLVTRSRLAQAMLEIPRFGNVLIIEDDQRDSDRLVSTLRSIFGYEQKVRQCRTLGTALDAVMAEQPDLVFLDDHLGSVDRAEHSVPFLRTARCMALVIVVSSHVDRRRRAALLKLDIGEVIAKDDLDSTSICQALVDAVRRRSAATPPEQASPNTT